MFKSEHYIIDSFPVLTGCFLFYETTTDA